MKLTGTHPRRGVSRWLSIHWMVVLLVFVGTTTLRTGVVGLATGVEHSGEERSEKPERAEKDEAVDRLRRTQRSEGEASTVGTVRPPSRRFPGSCDAASWVPSGRTSRPRERGVLPLRI